MIRTATLLPALILAFGLAGSSLAMAAGSHAGGGQASQNHPLQGHPARDTGNDSCNTPADCSQGQ